MKILNSDGRWNLHTHTKYCDGKDEPEALVRRGMIPAGFVTERTNLEDIILFLAKEGT